MLSEMEGLFEEQEEEFEEEKSKPGGGQQLPNEKQTQAGKAGIRRETTQNPQCQRGALYSRACAYIRW